MENHITNRLTSVWKTWAPDQKEQIGQAFSIEDLYNLMAHIFCPGPFYFYIFDFTRFEFLYIHPSVQEILGPKALFGDFQELTTRLHPDDIPFMTQCEKMAAYFYFNSLPPEEVPHYKVRLRADSGAYKLILHQALAHSVDTMGKILTVFGVHTDISHLMQGGNRKMSFANVKGGTSFYGLDPYILDLAQLEEPVSTLSPRELEVLFHLS